MEEGSGRRSGYAHGVELDGARVLVTGGGRRLGAALARDLAAHGCHVAVSYRTSADGAAAVVREVEAAGRGAAALRADLAVPAQARALVHDAADALGGLDGIVHAASGGFAPKPLAEVTEADVAEALGATLVGAIFVAQAAAERLADGGALVLVGDVAGVRGWPAYLPHTAAKSGLRGLVSGLARALGPRLRVSMVHPGLVLPPYGDEEASAGYAARLPLGRIGAPEDVAGAVRYLLAAPYVTGVELRVDGGRLAL